MKSSNQTKDNFSVCIERYFHPNLRKTEWNGPCLKIEDAMSDYRRKCNDDDGMNLADWNFLSYSVLALMMAYKLTN